MFKLPGIIIFGAKLGQKLSLKHIFLKERIKQIYLSVKLNLEYLVEANMVKDIMETIIFCNILKIKRLQQ